MYISTIRIFFNHIHGCILKKSQNHWRKNIPCHWRKPSEKQAYLAQFSSAKWTKTTELRKNLHSLQKCKCCTSFHASISETFPEIKQNRHKYKGPSSDLKNTSAAHIAKKSQPTKGELKAIGEMIVCTYNKTCKENLGKLFSEVLLVAPQLNLQEKPSACEKKKKQRLKTQRQFKASVEDM